MPVSAPLKTRQKRHSVRLEREAFSECVERVEKSLFGDESRALLLLRRVHAEGEQVLEVELALDFGRERVEEAATRVRGLVPVGLPTAGHSDALVDVDVFGEGGEHVAAHGVVVVVGVNACAQCVVWRAGETCTRARQTARVVRVVHSLTARRTLGSGLWYTRLARAMFDGEEIVVAERPNYTNSQTVT